MLTSKVFEVELTGLAYGGDAFGRLPDGRAVFVPFGLPGERVQLRLVEEKAHFARGSIEKILSPTSDKRIAPHCRHFGDCGGCHYQHMTYANQLDTKQSIIKDQFNRIASIHDAPVNPIVPSQREWNYRNHIQFHVDEQGQLGFQIARGDHIVAVQECFLPEAPISEIWPQLHFEADTGIERVGVRSGADNEIVLVLESSSPLIPEFEIEGLPLSVVHINPAGSVVLAGEETIRIEIFGVPFQVSAGSFFQTNTGMAEKMVQHILDNLLNQPGMLALDLYCGVGLFSAFIAPRVSRLVGVESSPASCQDFSTNLDRFDNVDLYEAEVEQVLPALDYHPDLVVADPPRSGMSKQALQGILRMAPKQLVYISCDPATLSRDTKHIVQAGYRLELATPFDLFPQTYHIETICFFSLQ